MEREMRVRPGTPDDDNREYLPEKIKNSDIVVNENGNNSQPYPERLKEYREVLADGVEDIWYEYVPEGYDPSKKTPLVVSMHGGLMTGWGPGNLYFLDKGCRQRQCDYCIPQCTQ